MGSDWSLGSVHVMEVLSLVNMGEDLHVYGMAGTCMQGEGLLIITSSYCVHS